MKRPFSKEKIVFDPDEETFYLVSQGLFGSPRPFRNIVNFYKDGVLFPASEAKIRECMIAKSGQRFGAGLVGSKIGLDAIKFEDLPPEYRQLAVKRARQYCVGVLESAERSDLSQKEIDQKIQQVLEGIEITDRDVEQTLEEIEEAGNAVVDVDGGKTESIEDLEELESEGN